MESDTWETLRHFRQALYDDLGLRQDSLFELLDATLTSPQRSTLVRHSLSTVFRRRWPSACDALSDGSIDTARLRGLYAGSLADSAVVEGRPVWVIDGTNWPRPAAGASADRTWEYRRFRASCASGGTPAEQEAAPAAPVVGLDRRSTPGRPERPLALVPAALHG